MLKSKKFLKLIALLVVGLLSSVIIFWSLLGTVWTQWDFQALDLFYKQAVKQNYGVESSSQVVYLNITDKTYEYFGKNFLDRADLAKVNDALAEFGAEVVAYDIIFSRPSSPTSDQRFEESIENLGNVYLPIGFELSEQARPFKQGEGEAYKRLRNDFLKKPVERGTAKPFYAIRATMQLDNFSQAAINSGHISAVSDADGVYRHAVMLVKIDSLYLPSLSLSMLLDYAGVSFDEILVDWGNEIRIPVTKESFLEQDVIIPIDERGRAFIPYPQVWGRDFKQMAAHSLLNLVQDEDLRGNLTEFFEGKFVFIGDVSVGSTDLGQTPLEDEVPLISMHAAIMNGLLTNSFYRKWSFWPAISLICFIGMLIGVSVCPKSSWIIYVTGGLIMIAIVLLTGQQMINFTLFPVVAVGGSSLFVFFGLVVGLQIATSKDQAFIRNAFSKYVPEKVVNELLVHPELLQLGGEERVLTVLFSDLEGFTTISENMPPKDLVKLLNDYFTEMTEIILAEGGIIDKFEGDAIMAEFGAPIPVPNHADMAVRAALKMQHRLRELRRIWSKNGLPELKCRVGINTGPMLIGNLGSHHAFDYTVIGDAVNLAARLENANKQYQTFVLISEYTHEQLSKDMFRTRLLDEIKVKGKSKTVRVYEVYGETSESMEPKDLTYYQTYHEAFEAYLSQNFSEALKKFSLTLSLHPHDPAPKNMIDRINSLNPEDLPEDWDGSIVLSSK